MELISLRIRTKETEYGQVLATVLRRNYPGFLITSSVIGEEGEVAAAGSTGSWGYDLGLCDDRASLQDGDVLLVDSPALETVGADGSLLREEGPVCVFKYAPAREMIEKILGLCSARCTGGSSGRAANAAGSSGCSPAPEERAVRRSASRWRSMVPGCGGSIL